MLIFGSIVRACDCDITWPFYSAFNYCDPSTSAKCATSWNFKMASLRWLPFSSLLSVTTQYIPRISDSSVGFSDGAAARATLPTLATSANHLLLFLFAATNTTTTATNVWVFITTDFAVAFWDPRHVAYFGRLPRERMPASLECFHVHRYWGGREDRRSITRLHICGHRTGHRQDGSMLACWQTDHVNYSPSLVCSSRFITLTVGQTSLHHNIRPSQSVRAVQSVPQYLQHLRYVSGAIRTFEWITAPLYWLSSVTWLCMSTRQWVILEQIA